MFKKEESPDDAGRTFNNRHHPNIIQGLNRKYNCRHRSSWSRDRYFPPTLRNYFTNARRWYFFTVADALLFGVAVKIYNLGRLGFFVRAQPKLCFGRHHQVFIYSARKTFAHRGKKNYSLVLIENNPSRHWQRKFTNRGLKINHLVTPIEHFEIDIIQILFRDWIDKTTANISREIAATAIFLPTLCRLFYKRWL